MILLFKKIQNVFIKFIDDNISVEANNYERQDSMSRKFTKNG